MFKEIWKRFNRKEEAAPSGWVGQPLHVLSGMIPEGGEEAFANNERTIEQLELSLKQLEAAGRRDEDVYESYKAQLEHYTKLRALFTTKKG